MDDITKKQFEGFSQKLAMKDKYTLKCLPDGKVWIMENLKERVEGAFWDEDNNCYLYTLEQAKRVVVPGFHIPTRKEFENLCQALDYGQGDNQKAIQRLKQECGFTSISSFIKTNNEHARNILLYWAASSRFAGVIFCLACTPWSIYANDDKIAEVKRPLRLIQD